MKIRNVLVAIAVSGMLALAACSEGTSTGSGGNPYGSSGAPSSSGGSMSSGSSGSSGASGPMR
jgi:hypothetical protein